MRDVITSVAAFLILAVLATGVYAAREYYQHARTSPAINAPKVADLEAFINSLLGGNPATPPAIAMPTITPQESSPTPTPAGRVSAQTPTPTPPPPPPTPQALPTPTPGGTATVTVGFPYTLKGQPHHDNACGGDMILGQVQDKAGKPLSGVIVRLESEGQAQTVQTAQGGSNKGRYVFRLTGKPHRIYVQIVDEGGNPLSPRVEILHLLPNSGYEAFHCHYLDWQYNR